MDRKTLRAAVTRLTIVGLLLGIAPIRLPADERMARLEGLVIDARGRPAAGATVYLFDDSGVTRAEAVSSSEGLYSLSGLAAGHYGMSVRTPEGIVAPVSSAPVEVRAGGLVRRDLKLVQADAATVDRALTANYSFGSWFGGLTGAEKAGVIVGFIAVGALIYTAFDDDDAEPVDDGEQPASPM